MNEKASEDGEREPSWKDGVVIFHPVFVRIFSSFILWSFVRLVTDVTHFCALGFKRAEALAPYVVATLAVILFVSARTFRRGLLFAGLITILYLFVVWPLYVEWVHGPGRIYFPDAVTEAADWVDSAESKPAADPMP